LRSSEYRCTYWARSWFRRKSQRARFATLQYSSNFFSAPAGSGTRISSGSFGGLRREAARISSGVPLEPIETTHSSISFDAAVPAVPFVFWRNARSGISFSSDAATSGFCSAPRAPFFTDHHFMWPSSAEKKTR
jgi:hypothetical protein